MTVKQTQLAAIVQKDPGVDYVLAFAGSGGGGATTTSAACSSPSSRAASATSAPIRSSTACAASSRSIPGRAAVPAGIAGHPRRRPRQRRRSISTRCSDSNLDELNDWAPKLLDRMKNMPELRDVSTDQQENGLEASLVVDRDTASRLGLTMQDIDNVLYDAFGQRQVSTMYTGLNQYYVVMEVDPEIPARSRRAEEHLHQVIQRHRRCRSPRSLTSKIAAPRSPSTTPASIPSITLSFNLAPERVARPGRHRARHARSRRWACPAACRRPSPAPRRPSSPRSPPSPCSSRCALGTVYIVLGILYESYVHPITILSTLPSAGVGAILALLLTHTDLSVIAMIGIILLIGIVKKNAIMMIDFALAAEREEGKSPEAAIYEACLLRFRPIMMTTCAALLGGLPLALGTGTGSEFRRPLGITIVGGLIVSQMLTLFTTPVVYLMFDRIRLFFIPGPQGALGQRGAARRLMTPTRSNEPKLLYRHRSPQARKTRYFPFQQALICRRGTGL